MKYLLLLLPLSLFSQLRDTVPTILLVSDTSYFDRSTMVSGVMNSGYEIYSPRQYVFYIRGYVQRERDEIRGIGYIWISTKLYMDEQRRPLPKSIYVWDSTVK